MSAHRTNLIYIDVTNGDCLIQNKRNGKSNTGTYFVCSRSNYCEFESYFSHNYAYKVDLVMVDIYKKVFNCYFRRYANDYIGKMIKFDSYCEELISRIEYPNIDITLRVNGDRVFMRFKNNKGAIENAFRNVLYEGLSTIVLEQRNNHQYYIYPIINEDRIREENNRSSELFIYE